MGRVWETAPVVGSVTNKDTDQVPLRALGGATAVRAGGGAEGGGGRVGGGGGSDDRLSACDGGKADEGEEESHLSYCSRIRRGERKVRAALGCTRRSLMPLGGDGGRWPRQRRGGS